MVNYLLSSCRCKAASEPITRVETCRYIYFLMLLWCWADRPGPETQDGAVQLARCKAASEPIRNKSGNMQIHLFPDAVAELGRQAGPETQMGWYSQPCYRALVAVIPVGTATPLRYNPG